MVNKSIIIIIKIGSFCVCSQLHESDGQEEGEDPQGGTMYWFTGND